MSYNILSQTAVEVADLGNAPALAIGPYLLKTEQTHLLRIISIYAQRGDSREQIRRLRTVEGDGQDGEHLGRDKTSTDRRDPSLRRSVFGIVLLTIGTPLH